jgi:murein DD-endopeptidase MepM/ murein hydrolase activator NlpD
VIAGIINERFPYGNAVIVETALDLLPAEQLSTIEIPTPAPIQPEHPSLTCPEVLDITSSIAESRSIYLMYAHLKEPVRFTIGDAVICGTTLGAIGNSGNSINPHVHFELRVGPSNMRFESMAHYTGSASPEEMANYCLWRVSNAFQLLDPMELYDQTK